MNRVHYLFAIYLHSICILFAICLHSNHDMAKHRFIPLSNILTKTCRGKVMKEKLKCVKTGFSLFILHSSFSERPAFTARKVRFDRAKDHVSCDET